ncbi:MAG: DUF2520 domain-containing protein [Nitrospirae bacterium]|nr:DUF2520 domain-containing protein [Nitrospirota bacterium]
MNRPSISIIGAGVLGASLGYLLMRKGYRIAGVSAHSMRSARGSAKFIGGGIPYDSNLDAVLGAKIIFITTPDDMIKRVCDELAIGGTIRDGSFVFHMSGALPSNILASARRKGASIGSIHPLQSLATRREAITNLIGSYYNIEGDKKAVIIAKRIVKDLGSKEMVIPAKGKVLYHSGAVFTSNYLITIFSAGIELLGVAGIPRSKALPGLLSLIKGTVKNIENVGIPMALTGPIQRGDISIIEGHIDEIRKSTPELLSLYCQLGKETVKIALEKGGISEKEGERLTSLFNRNIKKG